MSRCKNKRFLFQSPSFCVVFLFVRWDSLRSCCKTGKVSLPQSEEKPPLICLQLSGVRFTYTTREIINRQRQETLKNMTQKKCASTVTFAVFLKVRQHLRMQKSRPFGKLSLWKRNVACFVSGTSAESITKQSRTLLPVLAIVWTVLHWRRDSAPAAIEAAGADFQLPCTDSS